MKKEKKEFKIRTYLTGIIWLALACSDDNFSITFCVFKAFSKCWKIFLRLSGC